MAIRLKSKAEIEKMRAAGRVVRKVLNRCQEVCKPGVTTREIDEEAYRVYTAEGARGLFKNYPTYRSGEGFPANLCISVNEEVVHGIASDRKIRDGDIVGVDCGVQLDGWCGDAATTILVGNVRPEVKKLCEVTQHVLDIAIENIRPGRRWSQIARLMQGYAEEAGLSVVRDFVGHGIGQQMHEDPKVPNFVSRDLLRSDIVLREGVVLAIEPMCNLGTKDVITLPDGWTVLTVDRKPSAHYEHTVAVTANGADVLTDGR
ncbi:MAG: type I methionyl aminopeptidase [Phycisphaeraceae bacterium]|nr:type I methionyl aminopeptidase [Phycisphaeraceae bacterium]